MYAKVFDSMYDGTLATNGPWQAVVTFQQMLILSDPAGIVDMTPEAIARRTTVPLEIIKTGIEALEQPDPDSRRSEEEGRRIVRLSEHRAWGWQIVNHGHYKALRTPEDRREYMREYQRKRRASAEDGVNKSVNNVNAVNSSKESCLRIRRDRSKDITPMAGAEGFDRFWKQYPRKEAKKDALAAWNKLAPDDSLANRIVGDVEKRRRTTDWTKEKGKYVPHPASYLNGRRWEDESGHERATSNASVPY